MVGVAVAARVAVEAKTLALVPVPAAALSPPPTPSIAKLFVVVGADSITLAVNLSQLDGGSGGFEVVAFFNEFASPPISLLGGGGVGNCVAEVGFLTG